jgi:Zn-dependent peptidase ImmA (M78 family)
MIGDRIRLARRKARLSLRNLAAAMGHRVTAQAISKYERCRDIPSADVISVLAQALNVSVDYLSHTPGPALSGVEFASKANAAPADRASVEVEVLERVERYLQLEHMLELDSADWKSPIASPRKLRAMEDAEGLAREVRERWQLGIDPIPNLTELFEEKGLKVLMVPLPEPVSGFTCMVSRQNGTSDLPVVVINSRSSLERRRMTLSYELAHRLVDPCNLEDRALEKAANLFSGAFLMPQEHLFREVGTRRNALGYNELIAMKRLYRVSGAALLLRLKQVGAINESILTYTFQTIARGWRTQEPCELEPERERGQRERPLRFERLCYRALAEDYVSLSRAAELLRLPLPRVEAGLRGPQADLGDHHGADG